MGESISHFQIWDDNPSPIFRLIYVHKLFDNVAGEATWSTYKYRKIDGRPFPHSAGEL